MPARKFTVEHIVAKLSEMERLQGSGSLDPGGQVEPSPVDRQLAPDRPEGCQNRDSTPERRLCTIPSPCCSPSSTCCCVGSSDSPGALTTWPRTSRTRSCVTSSRSCAVRSDRPRYRLGDRLFLAAASRLLPRERWSAFLK